MYRLQQQLVSWVVGQIADVAEIDPENIAPSLMSGQITLSDLKLRVHQLNKLLPVVVEEGLVGQLRVSVPWLSRTVQPITIHIEDVKVSVSLSQSKQCEDVLSLEETLHSLRAEDILGESLAPNDLDRSTKRSATERQDSTVASDDDDDDFHSCRSDSDTESSGSDSDDEISPQAGTSRGVFRSVVSAVAHYVTPSSLSAPRPLRFHLARCRIGAACDDRRRMGIHVEVGSMTVAIEPAVATSPKLRVQVMTIQIRDAAVKVNRHATEYTLGVIPCLDVTETTTTDPHGNVLAKNVSVAHKQDGFHITLTNPPLDLLSQCIAAVQMAKSAPSYAQPFLALRRSTSLWPYARAAVLAQIADRRRRWNFNLSHLRVFTVTRRHYLELLDRCHREGDVQPHRTELASAEHDLHYRDVVVALRRIAQDKFNRQFSIAPEVSDEVPQRAAVSLHCAIESIHVEFPEGTQLTVSKVAVIKRTDDTSITVASVQMEGTRDTTQYLSIASGCINEANLVKTPAFISMKHHVDPSRCITIAAIELQPVRGHFSAIQVLGVLRPLIVCGLRCIRNASPSDPQDVDKRSAATGRTTVSLQCHEVDLTVDALMLRILRFSASHTNSIDGSGSLTTHVVGCSELSVQLNGTYVLHPFALSTADRRVSVSPIRLDITTDAQSTLQSLGTALLQAWEPIEQEARMFATHVSHVGARHERPKAPPSLQPFLGRIVKVDKKATVVVVETIEVHVVLVPYKIIVDVGNLQVRSANLCVDGETARGIVTGWDRSLFSIQSNDATLECTLDAPSLLIGPVGEDDSRAVLTAKVQAVDVSWRDRGRLCRMSRVSAAISDGDIAMDVASLHVFESVAVSPVKINIARLRSAVPCEFSPYNASNVTLVLNIERVDLTRMPTADVLGFQQEYLWNFCARLGNALMSESDQRYFMSGLSDLFVQLSASSNHGDASAEIVVNDTLSLFALVSLSAAPRRCSSRTSGRSFTGGSPQIAPRGSVGSGFGSFGSLITVSNDCYALSVTVALPAITARLSPLPDSSTQAMEVCVEGLQCLLPMSRMDFWTDPAVAVVEPVAAATRFDRFSGRVVKAANSDSVSSPLLEVSLEKASYAPPDATIRRLATAGNDSSDDSDHDQAAGGSIVRSILVEKLRLFADVKRIDDVKDALLLWQDVSRRAVVPSNVGILSASARDRTFSRGHCECVDAPHQLIVFENCEFLVVKHLVVRKGTACVFRRCKFVQMCATVQHTTVVCEDDSATILLECCEHSSEESSTQPVPGKQPMPETNATEWTVHLGSVYTALNCGFANIDVRSQISRMQVVYSDDRVRGIVVRAHMHNLNASALHDGHKSQIVDHVSFHVELMIRRSRSASLHAGNRLSLLLHLNCSTIRVPLNIARQLIAVARDIQQLVHGLPEAPQPPLPSSVHHGPVSVASMLASVDGWSWSIDLSVPSVEVALCLPGELPIASVCVTQSSAKLHRQTHRDKAECFATTTLHMSSWDPVHCCSSQLLIEPLVMSCTATIGKAIAICCEAAPISIALSDTLVRMLVVVPQLLASNVPWGPSLTIVNDLGCPIDLSLGASSTPITVVRQYEETNARVEGPLAVTLRGSSASAALNQWDVSFEGDDAHAPATPYSSKEVHVLPGMFVSATLRTTATLGQCLHFRSMIHLFNALPDADLILRGTFGATDRPSVVAAGQRASIPLSLIDDPNFHMILRNRNGELGMNALLPHCSARTFAQRALNEGAANLGRKSVIDFKGDYPHVVDVLFDVQKDHKDMLSITVAAGLPSFVNHLPFDICIAAYDAIADGAPLHVLKLSSGSEGHLYHATKNWSGIYLQIESVLPSGTFTSYERVTFDTIAATDDDLSMVMYHSEKLAAQCFEISLLPHIGGGRSCVSVTSTNGFVLVNRIGGPVVLASAQGNALGSAGDSAIPSCGDGLLTEASCSLLPCDTPIVVSGVSSQPSDEFVVLKPDIVKRTVLCPMDAAPLSVGVKAMCLFLALQPMDIPGLDRLHDVAWRSEVKERSWKCWELIAPLVFVNDSGSNITIRHTVVAKNMAPTATPPETFVVQPSKRQQHCVLAVAGFLDVFEFSNSDTGGSAFGDAVVFPLLPNTSERFCVDAGGARKHQVFVDKGEPCSPAVVRIGPPSQPLVHIVNLTRLSFAQCSMIAVADVHVQPRAHDLLLTHVGSSEKQSVTVQLKHGSSSTMASSNVVVSVRAYHGRFFLRIQEAESDRVRVLPSFEEVPATVDLPRSITMKLGVLSVSITSMKVQLMHCGFDALSFWASGDGDTWTVQGTLSRFTIQNRMERSHTDTALLAPISADFAVLDARILRKLFKISARSLRFNITRIEVSITDVFLAEVSRCVTRCLTPIHPLPQLPRQDQPQLHVDNATHATPWVLCIQTLIVAELRVVFSWDRNSSNPTDDILRGFLVNNFIGSVRNASLVFPMFHRDFGRAVPIGEVTGLKQHYVTAMIQQSMNILSSYKALGAPLSFATQLVSGFSGVLSNSLSADFFRKGWSSPLSLFGGTASSEVVEGSPAMELAGRDEAGESWLCTHCSKIHDSGMSLRDIYFKFGPPALAHHSTLAERIECLRRCANSAESFLLAAAITFTEMPQRESDAMPVPSSSIGNELLLSRYSLQALLSASFAGFLPPLSDSFWDTLLDGSQFCLKKTAA